MSVLKSIVATTAVITSLASGASVRAAVGAPSAAQYESLATQTEECLQKDVLSRWFSAAVDESGGGFVEDFAGDWTRQTDNGNRSIVYQSRLTWLAAEAAVHDPGRAAEYLRFTRHGIAFLSGKQWDSTHGGFFWSVNVNGNPSDDHPDEKHAYGMAFGIYAAATSYQVTRDPAAMELAKRAFVWLDAHAHDARNGGYFEALDADGKPIGKRDGNDAIGTRFGEKSMNTHIHLLEALQELYGVWPDGVVRSRLAEVFGIVRDEIYTEPGYLTMFFEPDWQPIAGRDSFGHDVETAYLLTEAAGRLGEADDEKTWRVARRLVDHAMLFGWDKEHGGLYNEGEPGGSILDPEKIWWVQAELLNALLLMHERFGAETPKYWESFQRQWAFISKSQIDHRHGGWYPKLNADGSPVDLWLKSDKWTEGYHQGRALLNVTDELRKLSGETSKGVAP